MARKHEDWTDELDEIDPYADDDKPPASEQEWAYDSRGIRYNKNAGSQSPTKGRCNAMLSTWEERYSEPRYCTRVSEKFYKCDGDSDFCKKHKGKEGLMQQARDIMSHGMFTKSFAHFFDKSDPAEKIMVVALFESLISESIYKDDFEINKKELTLDFDESDYNPEDIGVKVDEDNKAYIAFPEPTNREIRALALLEAATDEVKMLKANSEIFESDMKTESASEVATDEGTIGEVYNEYNEHYLNLPYSRLVDDQKENLKRGGVDIEGIEAEDNIESSVKTFDSELPTPEDFETGDLDSDETEVVLDITEEAKEELDE